MEHGRGSGVSGSCYKTGRERGGEGGRGTDDGTPATGVRGVQAGAAVLDAPAGVEEGVGVGVGVGVVLPAGVGHVSRGRRRHAFLGGEV